MIRIWMLFGVLAFLGVLPGATSCTPEDTAIAPNPGTSEPAPDPGPMPDPTPGNNLRITIGSVIFSATFVDNAAVRSFKALLPMTLQMQELNGNEKFYNLSENLPTATSGVGTIRTGDLMLWGSNCLVLFYETFQTSYRYTPIARLDDVSGLAAALGSGSVTVVFELTD